LEAPADPNDRNTLLFLPPYNPRLNPIEEVWGWAKNYLARNRPTDGSAFSKETTERLFKRGLDLANPAADGSKRLVESKKYSFMWEAAVGHAQDHIKELQKGLS